MSAYKPVSMVEVSLWGERVGALALDPSSGYIAFEYDPKFARTGWQPSPLLLPVQPRFGVSAIEERIDRTVDVASRWRDYAQQVGVDEETAADIGSVIDGCTALVRG